MNGHILNHQAKRAFALAHGGLGISPELAKAFWDPIDFGAFFRAHLMLIALVARDPCCADSATCLDTKLLLGRWQPVLASKEDIPPAARFISFPYNLDAVYNKKRTLLWVGYKAHFAETCDDDAPHLRTHVGTTNASLTDDAVTERIHIAHKEKRLLPHIHVVDTGYQDAKLLVESEQSYGIDLL